jgi:hypothetical protein
VVLVKPGVVSEKIGAADAVVATPQNRAAPAPMAVVRIAENIVTDPIGCSVHPFGQFAVVQARHDYTWSTAREGSKAALAAMLAAAERMPDLRAAWNAGQVQPAK